MAGNPGIIDTTVEPTPRKPINPSESTRKKASQKGSFFEKMYNISNIIYQKKLMNEGK